MKSRTRYFTNLFVRISKIQSTEDIIYRSRYCFDILKNRYVPKLRKSKRESKAYPC